MDDEIAKLLIKLSKEMSELKFLVNSLSEEIKKIKKKKRKKEKRAWNIKNLVYPTLATLIGAIPAYCLLFFK